MVQLAKLARRSAFAGILASVTTLAPTALAAQGTDEQRAACMGDAFRVCGMYIPNIEGVTICMKRNYWSLSAQCQAQFGGRPPVEAGRRPRYRSYQN